MSKNIIAPRDLTVEMVTKLLSYNSETGEFRWNERRGGKSMAGSLAGSLKPSGYLLINIYGNRYRAHHLAWFMTYGEFPAMLDHVNGDRADNRISNLRIASASQNMMNRRVSDKCSSGIKNVVVDSRTGFYRVEVSIPEGKFESKTIKTLSEAEALAKKVRAALHGEFSKS